MTRRPGQINGLFSPMLEKNRIRKIIRYVQGNDILDFGCGTGRFSEVISFGSYTGVDLDPRTVGYARQVHAGRAGVRFFEPEGFRSETGHYDCIILSAVIEHLPEPLSVLAMLRDRLRPGGIIIITTPTRLGNRILRQGVRLRLFSRGAFVEHVRIFSRADFIRIAEDLDLEILKYETFELGANQLVVLRK